MRIIDLTHTYTNSMPVYPGDVAPDLTEVSTDGIVDNRLSTGMHVGTHIDAPLHMRAGGKMISQMPIERFVGRGVLIDARGQHALDASLFEKAEIESGDIVLVLTGRSKHYRTNPAYFTDFPDVTEAAANYLIDRKISMLGLDSAGPDHAPYPIHKLLFSKDIMLIENLTNLEALVGEMNFQVIALPPKIEASGSPARVIAVVNDV